MRKRRGSGLILLIGSLGASLRAEEVDRPLDCGPSCLYVLLKLMKHDATYAALPEALPAHDPSGYSLKELREAASRLGVPLTAVRFTRQDGYLEGPAIAHLQSGREGHFVVLMPVGVTRRMVQVIDPPSAPVLRDLDQLLASSEWTGSLLLSTPPSHRAAILLTMTGLVVASVVAVRLIRRRHASLVAVPSARLGRTGSV